MFKYVFYVNDISVLNMWFKHTISLSIQISQNVLSFFKCWNKMDFFKLFSLNGFLIDCFNMFMTSFSFFFQIVVNKILIERFYLKIVKKDKEKC